MPAMDRYWEQLGTHHDSQWHDLDTRWKADTVQRVLERHGIRPHSICDIGCGTGAVLEAIAERSPCLRLVGYEPSSEALSLAPEEPRRRSTLVHGPSTIDNDTFDVLLCLDVFEHVENPFEFLRAIRSKAPLALFNIPLDLTVLNACRPSVLIKLRERIGHLHYFTAETALSLLSETGYSVVSATYSDSISDESQGSRGHRLMQTVRRKAAALSPALTARFLGGLSLFVLAETRAIARHSEGSEPRNGVHVTDLGSS